MHVLTLLVRSTLVMDITSSRKGIKRMLRVSDTTTDWYVHLSGIMLGEHYANTFYRFPASLLVSRQIPCTQSLTGLHVMQNALSRQIVGACVALSDSVWTIVVLVFGDEVVSCYRSDWGRSKVI